MKKRLICTIMNDEPIHNLHQTFMIQYNIDIMTEHKKVHRKIRRAIRPIRRQ